MAKTLADLIKSINESKTGKSFYTHVDETGHLQVDDTDLKIGEDGRLFLDKQGTLRRTFEEWGRNNALVQAVIDGHTTFSTEFYKAFGAYKTREDFTAPFVPPKGLQANNLSYIFELLEGCIGSYPHNDSFSERLGINKTNGITAGVAGGSAAGLVYSLLAANTAPSELRYISRRRLLKALVPTGAVIGGAMGLFHGHSRSRELKDKLLEIESNAEYLDKVIAKTFVNKPSAAILPNYMGRRGFFNSLYNRS